MSNNRIPTKEALARADAMMKQRHRGLSEVCDYLMMKYKRQGIHQVFLFYSPKTDGFYPKIFYNYDRQIQEDEASGLADAVKKDTLQALEAVGRGAQETLKVEFEFDSHENVVNNYEGDYFLRL